MSASIKSIVVNDAAFPAYPLDIVFADELPDTFIPPDEIIEDIITAGAGSVLYGDSHSGKTWLAINMACSVALGREWLGKRTEPGLVVYLAAESPQSVQTRLQAYQKHYGVKVPNLAIVRNPIDLFASDGDTNKIIQLVRQLEAERNIKAVLIIGDTLARLSAGANENAGQDMGIVVKHFDLIRNECKSHFMLIHHCGKNAAAGMRGWSGVRAAIDTEIEVTDSGSGRSAEITKQRDLSTKGEIIGFNLESIHMGYSKWNKPVTSCYVVPANAPIQKGKKGISLDVLHQNIFSSLSESISKYGIETPKEIRARFPDSPENCPKKVVHINDFRPLAYPFLNVKPESKRKTLKRCIEKLEASNKSMFYNDYLWIV